MSKISILSLCAGLGLFAACSSPRGNQPEKTSKIEDEMQSTRLITEEHSIEAEVAEFTRNFGPEPSFKALGPSIKEDETNDAVVSSAGNIAPEIKVAAPAPVTSAEYLESAKALLDEGKLAEARQAYTNSLHQWDLEASVEATTMAALEQINRQIFLSADAGGDMQKYLVERGDSLTRIGAKFGTTWEFLRRINGLERTTIYVGQELIVPKSTFAILIKKDRFCLDLTYNGALIKRYRIGTGIDGSTPAGELTVMERLEHPKDNGHEFGTPAHKLGSHWLGLKGAEGYAGYGIHGTPESDADKLGCESTEGSICLINQDVEELFDLLPVGSKVKILD